MSWVKLFDCSGIKPMFGALFPVHKKLTAWNSGLKSLCHKRSSVYKILLIDNFSFAMCNLVLL